MQAIVLILQLDVDLQPLEKGSWDLPIGQQPAVDLTLKWLERSAMNEVFLVTSPSSAGLLGTYLKRAGWTDVSHHSMVVHVLALPGCLSEGEALRYVEQQDVIKGDFVLISGSVVGNLDLRTAVQAHLVRRGADRHTLMTLVLHRGCTAGDTASANSQGCLVLVDSNSQQLLKLECSSAGLVQTAGLGTHTFGQRNSILVRGGLRPTNICICALDVLVLLSDNFDYQSVLCDLVPGVLSEQELGSTIYVHEPARGYLECICNRTAYVGILEDVVDRWTYPWVPDNLGGQQDFCRLNRGIYLDASAIIAPSGSVSKGSLVGRGSCVNAGACLDRSIIGIECHIGKGTILQRCCLHGRVQVDDSCKLSSALLAEHAVVRSHAYMETGALLARHAMVDACQCVPSGACVSVFLPSTAAIDNKGEIEWADTDVDALETMEGAPATTPHGSGSKSAAGFIEAVVGSLATGFAEIQQNVCGTPTAPFPFEDESHAADDDSESGDFTKDTAVADDIEMDRVGQQQLGATQFKQEVAETFLRCIKEQISHDNAVIELNGLKIAEDRTFADCARYIFTTMLSLCQPPIGAVKPEFQSLFPDRHLAPGSKEGRLELLRRLNAQLKTWKTLLQRFLKSNDDQVELLLTFEEFCAEEGEFSSMDHGACFGELFPQVVKLCYDLDLLSEDAILDWASEKENASGEERRFVELCTDLLAWLADAEEESSD